MIPRVSRKSISPDELKRLMSPERLGSYEQEMGSPAGAVALYEWNLAMSAALFESLGAVEVILRNAFHRELALRNSQRGGTGPWYRGTWIDTKGRRDVATARDRATGWGRQPELEGKVIAELSFGFWRYLVAKRYQTTAWPALQKAFPMHPAGSATPRVEIEDRMQRIHVLRNRIAHHEPIFRRNVAHDYVDMLTLVGWISNEASGWVEDLSRVPALQAQRPDQTA